MDELQRARRGLVIFFAVLIPLTAVVELMIVRRVSFLGPTSRAVLLMGCPAVASFVARLVQREGWGDVSFRLGGTVGRRALLQAFAFPLGVAALAYGTAWVTGLATFDPPTEDALVLPQWRWMVEISGEPWVRFVKALGLHLTAGAVLGCLWAAGEELGWRGYLVPRLLDARVPGALVLSGLIWSMWHWPLVLFAGGHFNPSRVLTALLFALVVIPVGVGMARLRLESGSMWPPIVLHGIWNEAFSVCDGASSPADLWLGESGLLVLAACLLLLAPLLRGSWSAVRAPGAEPHARVTALT